MRTILDICVTPCVGVWIEIDRYLFRPDPVYVTPCVGVWIEIMCGGTYFRIILVTPCVGVWIEIVNDSKPHTSTASLPAWECGLKWVMLY